MGFEPTNPFALVLLIRLNVHLREGVCGRWIMPITSDIYDLRVARKVQIIPIRCLADKMRENRSDDHVQQEALSVSE